METSATCSIDRKEYISKIQLQYLHQNCNLLIKLSNTICYFVGPIYHVVCNSGLYERLAHWP